MEQRGTKERSGKRGITSAEFMAIDGRMLETARRLLPLPDDARDAAQEAPRTTGGHRLGPPAHGSRLRGCGRRSGGAGRGRAEAGRGECGVQHL